MRSLKLALLPAAALLACSTLAHADALPVGSYVFDATAGTGIHLSSGTLTGTITFDSSSNITAADIVYTSIANVSYTFDTPGPISLVDVPPNTLESQIASSANPGDYYAFSIDVEPGIADGSFRLNCGTDCDTFVSIGPNGTGDYEEFAGTIVPAAATPEPSSFVLATSGMLALAGAARRRILNA